MSKPIADESDEREKNPYKYTFRIDTGSAEISADLDEYPGSVKEPNSPLAEADGIVVGDNPSPTLMEAAREYNIPILESLSDKGHEFVD